MNTIINNENRDKKEPVYEGDIKLQDHQLIHCFLTA